MFDAHCSPRDTRNIMGFLRTSLTALSLNCNNMFLLALEYFKERKKINDILKKELSSIQLKLD